MVAETGVSSRSRPQRLNPVSHKIELYRASGHFWLLDASAGGRGNVTFCSGGTGPEWYIYVRDQGPRLHTILSKKLGYEGDIPEDDDDLNRSILEMLSEMFGGRSKNPFSEIERFLTDEGVVWKGDFWS